MRPGFLAILFHRELLRFLANRALWVLLILFFLMGTLVSVSDVILDRDRFNIVVVDGQASEFLEFVAEKEPNIALYGPGALQARKGLNRIVLLKFLSETFDKDLRAGRCPALEISSPDLSQTQLTQFRDILIKDTFLFLHVQAPIDIRQGPLPGTTPSKGPGRPFLLSGPTEDFKRMIMALLITITLNIITFNLFTVSFVEEKQNRTLLAVLLSPARSAEVALAKGLFFLVPGLGLAAALTGVYRPDVLSLPVFWGTLVTGALLYMSMGLLVASFVERQSTASLICLGYLFFLTSMFILAPRFTALYPIKNHLPENFIFSTLSFLFDGTSFSVYRSFFLSFAAVSLFAPFAALAVFAQRTASRPPPSPRGAPRWTLLDCAIILALCLFFQVVISPMLASLIQSVPALARYRFSGILLLYLAVLAVPLAFILPLYVRIKHGKRFRDIGFLSSRPVRDLGQGAAWFAVYAAALVVAAWGLTRIVAPGLGDAGHELIGRLNPQQTMFFRTARLLLAGLGTWNWVLFGLVMGILVPALEEAYFRGCLLPALKARWGSRVAVAGSAMAFGFLHLNPLLFPVYFLLGLVAGILYERTGNLLAPVAFHSLNNLTSLVLLNLLL